MKDPIKTIFFKVAVSITLSLILFFIFQITYADQLSFSNVKIDHILHFTSSTVFILIVLMLFGIILLVSKRMWLKILAAAGSLLSMLLLLVTLVFASMIIFSSDKTNYRYYFSEKDGYKYYAISERFVAFEGSSEIHLYKEKTLFAFVKRRLQVTEEELRGMNIDPDEVYGKIIEYHYN